MYSAWELRTARGAVFRAKARNKDDEERIVVDAITNSERQQYNLVASSEWKRDVCRRTEVQRAEHSSPSAKGMTMAVADQRGPLPATSLLNFTITCARRHQS
jgi:hypothetical protein